jgi:P27 family predicted phage terminase small subunit
MSTKPPRELSAAARALWQRVVAEFEIADEAALLLLRTLCEAHDRMKRAQALIDKHGELIADKWGQLKANPACAVERDARAQMLQALKQLNLDIAPPGKPGRPAGGVR